MEKCIRCDSVNLVKSCIEKNGKQQYKCKDCNRRFTENSNPKRGIIINGEKCCTKCKTFKPLSDFFISEGKPRSRCKTCFTIVSSRNARYRTYNINEVIFNNMLDNQNHKCAICHIKFKSNRLTHIDHNHTTGEVRGLLCPCCNHILGFSKDNAEILKSAIQYLNEH